MQWFKPIWALPPRWGTAVPLPRKYPAEYCEVTYMTQNMCFTDPESRPAPDLGGLIYGGSDGTTGA